MTIALWGGGSPADLSTRIKTGDVAMDFYRPVGILGWYLAADVGRAAFHLVSRGVAPTLVGALLFDLRYPAGPLVWVAFLASVVLGLLVSFAIRFFVAIDEAPPIEVTGATVRKVEGPRQWLTFPADSSAAPIVAAVVAGHDVADLSVQEPDIEDVIRDLYSR